jgi:hypothetical protein
MAITKQAVTPQGFIVEDAYYRVESVTLLGKTRMNFSVMAYKDVEKESFSNNSYVCEYNLLGDNPIKQAYNHLKTLPDFADSIDC